MLNETEAPRSQEDDKQFQARFPVAPTNALVNQDYDKPTHISFSS